MIHLYDYPRSSACWRVRIALELKGLAYEKREIHLLQDGGQQHRESYRKLNPQELVPTLLDGEIQLTQSLAIIEYLDESYPNPPLLPRQIEQRAQVRQFALLIACDLHPLNNLRVLQYLTDTLQQSDSIRQAWYQHWMALGLSAAESLALKARRESGKSPYIFGDQPGLAEACLIPQLFNARRFACHLDSYEQLLEVEANCLALEAFSGTAPEPQPGT